jgi:hypothetical protein
MKPLRVLIVGCGNIAGGFDPTRSVNDEPLTHAGAYTRNSRFHLAGCFEPDNGRRTAFMQRCSVESGIASIDAAGRKLGSVDVVSIYSPADLRAGDTLTRKNVRAIRPGFGLPPKHLNDVLGKTVKRDVKRGTALDWSLL